MKNISAEEISRATLAMPSLKLVPGDALRLSLIPKGFGGENMSRLAMRKPWDGHTSLNVLFPGKS